MNFARFGLFYWDHACSWYHHMNQVHLYLGAFSSGDKMWTPCKPPTPQLKKVQRSLCGHTPPCNDLVHFENLKGVMWKHCHPIKVPWSLESSTMLLWSTTTMQSLNWVLSKHHCYAPPPPHLPIPFSHLWQCITPRDHCLIHGES